MSIVTSTLVAAASLAVGAAVLTAACGDVTANLIVPENDEQDACEGPKDCPTETPLCSGGRCVECATDETCTSPDLPICNRDRGLCVECIDDGDCTDEGDRCRLSLGVCAVPCAQGASCEEDDGNDDEDGD